MRGAPLQTSKEKELKAEIDRLINAATEGVEVIVTVLAESAALRIVKLLAENATLRAEIERLRGEREAVIK